MPCSATRPHGGGRNVGVTGPRGLASASHGRRRDQRRDPTGGRDGGDAGSGISSGSLFASARATHTMLPTTRTFQNVSRPKAPLPSSSSSAASCARIVTWRQPGEMVNKLPFASASDRLNASAVAPRAKVRARVGLTRADSDGEVEGSRPGRARPRDVTGSHLGLLRAGNASLRVAATMMVDSPAVG